MTSIVAIVFVAGRDPGICEATPRSTDTSWTVRTGCLQEQGVPSV